MQVDVYTETADSLVPFHCPSCGERRLAQVRAQGTGTGADGFVHADQDRRANAERLLRSAACPTCGQRDEPFVRRLKLKAGALSIAAALGGGVALSPLYEMLGGLVGSDGLGFFLVFCAGALAFGVPVHRGLRSRWWGGTADKVTFGDPIKASWPIQPSSASPPGPSPDSPFA